MNIQWYPGHMTKAKRMMQENIKLMYEHSGNKSNSFCRFCRKIADNYGFDISFGESIFNDIIAVQGSIDDILSDREGKRYWIYSPYDNWDEFCNSGVFTIGRDYLGDPTLYESRSDMQGAMLDYGTQADILRGNLLGYKGAIFENLMADFLCKSGQKLYYFHKDSGLEVDFLTRFKGECVLVEVKAKNGKAKSMMTVLKHKNTYHVNNAIKLGQYNVGREGEVLTIPLYMGFLIKEKLADVMIPDIDLGALS